MYLLKLYIICEKFILVHLSTYPSINQVVFFMEDNANNSNYVVLYIPCLHGIFKMRMIAYLFLCGIHSFEVFLLL